MATVSGRIQPRPVINSGQLRYTSRMRSPPAASLERSSVIHSLAWLVGLLIFVVAAPTRAQECAAPDGDWVFCDDFENGISSTWEDISNTTLTTTPANVFAGGSAIQMQSNLGSDNGGGMKLDLLPGYDRLFFRFYIKVSDNFGYPHHFPQLGGRRSDLPVWQPFGSAGCRPSGDNFFVSGLELDGGFSGGTTPRIAIPGRWLFYSYHMDMSGWGAGSSNCIAMCQDCAATRGSDPCPTGTCYHGNHFAPATDTIPDRGRWYCMEMRMEANTGSNADGSQAIWMDDVLLGDWGGIRWRDDPALNINALLLQHYTTQSHQYAPGQTQQTVWFDNIVLSRSRIGCIGSSPGDGGSGGGDPVAPGDPGAAGDPWAPPGDSAVAGDPSAPPGDSAVAGDPWAPPGDSAVAGDPRQAGDMGAGDTDNSLVGGCGCGQGAAYPLWGALALFGLAVSCRRRRLERKR